MAAPMAVPGHLDRRTNAERVASALGRARDRAVHWSRAASLLGLSLRPGNRQHDAVGVAAQSRAGWTTAGVSASVGTVDRRPGCWSRGQRRPRIWLCGLSPLGLPLPRCGSTRSARQRHGRSQARPRRNELWREGLHGRLWRRTLMFGNLVTGHLNLPNALLGEIGFGAPRACAQGNSGPGRGRAADGHCQPGMLVSGGHDAGPRRASSCRPTAVPAR
jgi:hypothetical protein